MSPKRFLLVLDKTGLPAHLIGKTSTHAEWSLTIPTTGNQGGSVARSLLKNKDFSVRGITRNPDSDAAKALATLGAEIVKADGFNKDEMKAAFNGSWAAFVNTQSEDPVP